MKQRIALATQVSKVWKPSLPHLRSSAPICGSLPLLNDFAHNDFAIFGVLSHTAHVLKSKQELSYARHYAILRHPDQMYFKEHGIAHFHAIYGEFNGVFNIETLELMEGDLPPRALRLVNDWAKKYQAELLTM